jgi:hypothetical protein
MNRSGKILYGPRNRRRCARIRVRRGQKRRPLDGAAGRRRRSSRPSLVLTRAGASRPSIECSPGTLRSQPHARLAGVSPAAA